MLIASPEGRSPMRHALLMAALASMAVSCGPEDEVITDDAAVARAAIEQGTMTMDVDELPTEVDLGKLLEALAAQVANELDAQVRPTEERFFYPVDVNAPPPALPAPPCPRCR